MEITKKMSSILMALLLVVSLMPLAFAEDNETAGDNETGSGGDDTGDSADDGSDDASDDGSDDASDDGSEEGSDEAELTEEDEEEIDDMGTPYGAEVRLLQLEKAITRNILAGELVIESIENSTPDADVSELYPILDEMEVLLEDIAGLDMEKPAEELAKDYVDIKHQARDLSKEFREKSRELLKVSDIPQLRERVREMDRNELRNINQEIAEARRNHNAERLQNMFKRMGATDPELIEKVRNGEADIKEVRAGVVNAFKGMDRENKVKALQKVREAKNTRAVKAKAALNRVRSNMAERLSNRAELWSEQAERLSERAGENGFQTRAERLNRISDRLQIAGDRLENRSMLQDRIADARTGSAERRNSSTGQATDVAGGE